MNHASPQALHERMAIVLITGGSGLIGSALSAALRANGNEVRHLGRRPGERNGIRTYGWDVAGGTMDRSALHGVDHIVHLAGAGIADKRWTPARVQELIDSRALSALLLLRTAQELRVLPKSFVSAAGINYYGAVTSSHIFTELDGAGNDTIGRISLEWEAAVDQWSAVCRVVKLRTPVVLAAHGGALPKLMAPVKWGLGAALGSGRQWMPWVHLRDLVECYQRALFEETFFGAYNVCAPEDVTNATLMRGVARVLGRPFFLPPVPGFMLKLALGELSSILLEGSRASNERLLRTGFRFQHPKLEGALHDLLGKR